jgi:flavin reductase (DIM6/NTAB) family NADH-FMN oxidoreductase RutF
MWASRRTRLRASLSGEREQLGRDALRRLIAPLDYAMFIVTAACGSERCGCLVGFMTQSSIDPVRFVVCISRANRTHEVACRVPALAVHLLREGERDVAELFGGATGDDLDKFARCDWWEGPGGLPILARCGDWFAGRVLARLGAGDHDAFVLEPFAAASTGTGSPLLYTQLRTIAPGHPA